MASSVRYIAASNNRFSHAADASHSTIAFGSMKLVLLWNFTSEIDLGISERLRGHEGVITCVRFVSDNLLLSADDQGVLICWRRTGSQWKTSLKIDAHSNSVSSLCVDDNCVVTGSSDGFVKVWKLLENEESDQLVEVQAIDLNGRYPLALALARLPMSQAAILAIAGTDITIQLWLRSEDKFLKSTVLAGHENWITSLAFNFLSASQSLVLASGSQDATIRLWNIEAWKRDTMNLAIASSSDILNDDLLDSFEASLSSVGESEEGGRQLSLKRHILTIKSDPASLRQYSVTFDALLVGHDAGITSLAWRPALDAESPLTLLSTSIDASLILWSPSLEPSSSIWINQRRFGDVGGQRLGGFVGGLWAPNGREAMAWGWVGGWRRWINNQTDASQQEVWEEAGAISGHRGPVKGLDWTPRGEFLASTGSDQTTRIHGEIPTNGNSSSWHELSRPQVHGYDLLNIAFINASKFLSIADEKVVRVFEAPRNFIELIESLGVAHFDHLKGHERPLSAIMPPLGLSNKAQDNSLSETPLQSSKSKLRFSRRPFDGELASSTLWPEIEKIFGHGYESITLDISISRRLFATACKSSSLEHATVRLYDAETFRPVGQPLLGHSLTVTRIAFSPDGKLILTVSRDRQWIIHELQEDGGYHAVAANKSHGRIVWDCAWANEGDVFATASRDRTVKIWYRGDGNNWRAVITIKTDAPATAVAFAPGSVSYRRRLAIGLESGEILIYSGSLDLPADWRSESCISKSMGHVDRINRLAWRPTDEGPSTMLASCSDDGTLVILSVQMTT